MKLRQINKVYNDYLRSCSMLGVTAAAVKESVLDACDRSRDLLRVEESLNRDLESLSIAMRLCPGAIDLLKGARADLQDQLAGVRAELNKDVERVD